MGSTIVMLLAEQVKAIEDSIKPEFPQVVQIGGHNICTEVRQVKTDLKALCMNIRLMLEAEMAK